MRRLNLMLVTAAVAMAGCEVQVDQPAGPADPGTSASGSGQTMQQGGGSALGKAKQSAHRIEDQVDLHNRRIEDAADAINDP